MNIYVSPDGSDTNPGTRCRPFGTLEGARRAIRKLRRNGLLRGGVTVWIAGGFYERSRSFTLTARDSGTTGAPVVYRAVSGHEARLVGGKRIPASAFAKVADRSVLKRLVPAARGKVVEADLKALGIRDLGDATALGRRPELFFNQRPMTLARWPNEGFTTIRDVAGGSPVMVHGIKGDKVGKLVYKGNRPSRWAAESDARLHGYWFWDWSDSYEKIASIDPRRRVIATAPPYHHYGYRVGQRFYAVNLLAELDTPGEWYVDRDRGILYFWPPAPISRAEIVFSMLQTPLVAMKGVSQVVLRGLTLEATRGAAIQVSGGAEVRVVQCTVRNTGTDAALVSGGTHHGVSGCHIYQTGAAGIVLSGGDRRRLTPSRHYAVDNHIHDFSRLMRTYAPALRLAGVGCRAAHNHIHHAPHMAVAFGGNDHVMELNEIHDVCRETGDVGVFYTGRDWTMRGNVIRHNFVHHVHGPGLWGAQVIYLDDAASGTVVRGNVIYRCARAMLIGGGRDNVIDNNIIVACEESIRIDNRGLNWMADHVGAGGVMQERLKAVPYRKPPWSRRYPKLVNILQDDPAAPKGNIVRRNVIHRTPAMNLAPEAEALGTVADNFTTRGPVGFANPRGMDFRLKKSSIIHKRIPGFKRIPFEKIGPRRQSHVGAIETRRKTGA